MEPLRQHVQHEAPDELARRHGHDLVARRSFDPVILDLERHALLVGADQPAVGDRDAVGVAGEISEHLLGPGERALGIDVPPGVIERFEPSLERCPVGEMSVRPEELQAAGLVRRLQHRQHFAAEQT